MPLTQENIGIGIRQTWQNVRASRVAGTTYTNSTGKPIIVAIWQSSTGTQIFYIDGVQVGGQQIGSANTGHMNYLVPNGSTYRCDTSNGTLWFELR